MPAKYKKRNKNKNFAPGGVTGASPIGSSSGSGGGGGGGRGNAPSFSRQAARAFSGTGTDAPASTAAIGPGKDGYPGTKTGQKLRQEAAKRESARLQRQITPDMTGALVKVNDAITTGDPIAIQTAKNNLADTGYKFGQNSRINMLNAMAADPTGFTGDPSLGFVNNKTGEKYNVNKIASMPIPDFNNFLNDQDISREGDPDSNFAALVNIGSMLMPGWPAAVVGAVKTATEASQGKLPFGISLPKAAGPNVTVQEPLKKVNAKKGGRTRKKVSRTKKNYSKGGGVRSAKY